MGIKFSKTKLLLFFMTIAIQTIASNKEEYYMKNVCIDNICMKTTIEDYRLFFEGKILKDTIVWNDYEEEYQRQMLYEGDSLYIYMSSFDTTRLYTKYIEIFSSKYNVILKNLTFKVGMDINVLTNIMPNIQQEYESYIGKNKKNFMRPAYFGIPLLLDTNGTDIPFYPTQGLKFQIKEGIVISILIDFRTDGDF